MRTVPNMDSDLREQFDRIAGFLDELLMESRRSTGLLEQILTKVDEVDAAVMMLNNK